MQVIKTTMGQLVGYMNQRTPTVYLFVFLLTACASGSSVVTGTVRTPIEPIEVKLYLEPPDEYEVIGIVKASSDSGWTEQGDMDYAVAELKNQAAKLGANGVILITTGESTSTTVGTYSTGVTYAASSTAQTLTGKAIYVGK
jgi:hypothetical protein